VNAKPESLSAAGPRPFSDEEIARRWSAAASEMRANGLDGLVVSQTSSFQWLTSHDAAGAYMLPYIFVLTANAEGEAIVRDYDIAAVAADAPTLTISGYRYLPDFGPSVGAALTRLGLAEGRVGFELGNWGIAPNDVTDIQKAVPKLHIVDGSSIVPICSDVKSAEEIAIVRQAAEFCDIATLTVMEAMHEGVAEWEVEEISLRKMREIGAGSPPNGVLGIGLGFGIRGTYPHSVASEYRLQKGDVVWTERGGFNHNYSTGLLRTACAGSNPHVEDLYAVAVETTNVTIEAMQVGATCGEVHAAAEANMRRHGQEQNYRTGYSIGINWWTRGHGSLEPGSPLVLVPGMTFHIPRVLIREGEFAVSNSETVLITENGPETLSKIAPEIFYV
jgi:Xaa-Pro aminopeptidase